MNQVFVIDPSSNHIAPIDGFKTQQWFNDLRKVVNSVNVGVENLHESLIQFTESLGISYDEKHWLPWDPLTTETEYTIRHIDIRKGGWGR
jgi:hypothetical protein